MSRAAGGIVGSPDLAWDAVQDVLLRVWNRGWLPAEPRSALCYLARLAGRQQLRAVSRRCRHEACAGSRECRYEDDPAVILERREERADVRRALADLGAHHRQLLQRHAFDGLDYRELSAEFGIPVGTVRSRLHRARRALERRLRADRGAERTAA